MNIYKIVLTGGPCAGKTEVIEKITKLLEENGYYVIIIPETASELISSKYQPQGNKKHILSFQEIILKAQTTKESLTNLHCQSLIDTSHEAIKNKKGIIVLCDRGIIDNRAYLSHDDYHALLKKFNYNELEILDTYDLVIDLISTATARPELYALNGVRYETIEEAAKKDQITSAAWLLHKNLKVILPTDTIEEKANLVFSHIINFIEQKKEEEISSIEVDKEKSDFSTFNHENSRKIRITSFHVQLPNHTKLVLDRKQSEENVSFVIKKENSTPSHTTTESISIDRFNELLNLSLLEQFNEEDILYFIHNGAYFKIVSNGHKTKLYTSQENIPKIPHNIVLKRTLTK